MGSCISKPLPKETKYDYHYKENHKSFYLKKQGTFADIKTYCGNI